jgi:hypothetical protein
MHSVADKEEDPIMEVTPSQRFFIIVYIGLLIMCTALILLSNFLNPTVRAALLPLSSDGFKTVLGALLGAISVMLGARG